MTQECVTIWIMLYYDHFQSLLGDNYEVDALVINSINSINN